MKQEHEHRVELVRFGRTAYERGFICACEGNLSVRLADDAILATPTGFCKGRLEPDDLVIVDPRGSKRAGRCEVSSEIGMHLLIYRLRPDAGAVVHAHPPKATGFAVAGVALDQPTMAEVVATLGSIPLARYGTPGTPELADALEPLIPHYDAILMANHGVVTYAADLERAFMHMELVEHFAEITLVAQQLGGARPLDREHVAALLAVRERYRAGVAAREEEVPVLSQRGRG